MFRVCRGVLIGVFRLGGDRGEVEVKHWELLLLLTSKSLLVYSPSPCAHMPMLGLNIVWSIWSSHAKDIIRHLK